ncbi:hypothetical protein LCGC14_1000250 [marine sediment metagenome]|uniref:Uncharacterized protein n=1 Tax=marine sediment metagenome TaxID=412755 RepID=A0A0F9N803_9ZZZZ
MSIKDTGKIAEGLASEVDDGVVRLYCADQNGESFPIIEIHSRIDEHHNFIDDDAELNKLAEQLRELWNAEVAR